MKKKRIRVSFGRTVNTGNFENFRIDADLEVEVEENEDLHKAYNEAYKEVVKQVNEKASIFQKKLRGED